MFESEDLSASGRTSKSKITTTTSQRRRSRDSGTMERSASRPDIRDAEALQVKPKTNIYVWGTLFNDSDESLHSCDPSAPETFFIDDEKINSPYVINAASMAGFQTMSCGKQHVAILTEGGELYTLGSNESGQLGLGEYSSGGQFFDRLQLVQSLVSLRLQVQTVACGHSHSLAVMNNG